MRRCNAIIWLASAVWVVAVFLSLQTMFPSANFGGTNVVLAASNDNELEPKGNTTTVEKTSSEQSTDTNAKKETTAKGKEAPQEKNKTEAEKLSEEKPKAEHTNNGKAADKGKLDDLGEEKLSSNDGIKKKESFLVWLYKSLGTRYVIIFVIVTFNAVALTVMIVLGVRRNMICPDELIAAFEAKLDEKQYQEAYELAKADRSFLGKVLAAGMSHLPEGYDAVLEAMQEVGEELNLKLEQRNGYIALIAQIGPMFGLLGTVDGMVMAFDVIAHSNVTPKPSELAQGIGTALVTTVVGLWIAIPSLAFYHIIRNRVARMVMEVGTVSGNLMRRFASVQPAVKK